MRSAAAILLLSGTAGAAGFMGRPPRPAPAGTEIAACAGLASAAGRLRAFVPEPDFQDQVFSAFSVEGSGEATARYYLRRGEELIALAGAVEAQCRAASGPGTSPAEAAAISRRAAQAQATADLYLDLPWTIARIDKGGDALSLSLRPQFLRAMDKIADGPDYAAAKALADDAHARLSRIRR